MSDASLRSPQDRDPHPAKAEGGTASSAPLSEQEEAELADILSAFEEEVREGDMPSVEQWAQRHPRFAEPIRTLFPGLLLMEHTSKELPSGAPRAPLPKRVGSFPIVRELGRGGMGIVYLARDEPLSRYVALKVFQKYGNSDERFLERFFREARAAGRLNHPHIVPIFETGQEDGVPYYTMLYIEGSTLDECLFELRRSPTSGSNRRQGSGLDELLERIVERPSSFKVQEDPVFKPFDLNWHECSRIGREVGEALGHAHERGILHRDVKPANIMIDREGHAWVNDFGLCHWKGETSMTEVGEIVGTLKYMAPEQLEGEPDERSDIYGLGLVLYELATCREAFPETRRARLIKQIISTDPPRPRKVEPAIPKDLETIILKATAKLPAERYSSVMAFVRDLEAFEEGRAISARPPSAWYLAVLLIKRQRLLTAVILFFLLASAVLTALYTKSLKEERQQRALGEYNARLTAAESALNSGSALRGQRQLELAPAEFRGWEWYHLWARMDQSVASYSVSDKYVRSVAYSPNGETILVASAGGVHLLKEVDGTIRKVNSLAGNINSAAWNTLGDKAYFVSSASEIFVWSVDGDEPPQSLGWGPARPSRLLFVAPNRLWLAGETGIVGEFNLDTNQWLVKNNLPGKVNALLRLPDGRPFALDVQGSYAYGDSEHGGVQGGVLDFSKVNAVAANPGNQVAFMATGAGSIQSLRLEDMSRIRNYPGVQGTTIAMSVSKDNSRLAVAGRSRQIKQWVVDSGEPLAPMQGHSGVTYVLDWHPDGHRLVSGDDQGNVKVWHPRVRGGKMELGYHFYDISDIRFSKDGSLVVTGCRDGTAIVWDRNRCVPLQRFLAHGRTIMGAIFVNNERAIVTVNERAQLDLWSIKTGRNWEHADVRSRFGAKITSVAEGESPDSIVFTSFDSERPGGTWLVQWSTRAWKATNSWWIPDYEIRDLEFDPISKFWIGVTEKGELLSLDTTNQVVRSVRQVREDGLRLHFLSIDPDTGSIVTGGWTQDIYVFKGGVDGERSTFHHNGSFIDHATFVRGQQRVVAGTRSGQVGVWSLDNGKHLSDIDTQSYWVSHLAADATGNSVIVGSSHGGLWIYDLQTTSQRIQNLGKGNDPEARTRLDLGRDSVLAGLQAMQKGTRNGLDSAWMLSWTFSIRNEEIQEAGCLHAAIRLYEGKPQKAIDQLSGLLKHSNFDPEINNHARCLMVLGYAQLGRVKDVIATLPQVNYWTLCKWQWALLKLQRAK